MAYFLFIFISQGNSIRALKGEIDSLMSEKENLAKECDKLMEEIDKANSPEMIEARARELGYLYPDEQKFVDSNS